jgi:hypothetical protein
MAISIEGELTGRWHLLRDGVNIRQIDDRGIGRKREAGCIRLSVYRTRT